MIATASHRRSTSSSWWLESTTGAPSAANSPSTPLITSTPTGPRPENGSSRTRTTGSWTSATASCTRCWLPSESCSVRSLSPSRSIQRRRRPPRSPGRAVQAREVDDLVADAHLRVQAALLGHVAEAPAHRGVDRPALPAHLAAVGLEDAEHDPHRGRLARPVGADEAEEPARLDRKESPSSAIVSP
jgi:hypothetical protein